MQSNLVPPQINTFTDWNKIIHNNLPIDQLIDVSTSRVTRDIPNDAGTSQEQIGQGLVKLSKIQKLNPHYQLLVKQLSAGPINWLVNHLPFEMHLRDGERKIKYNFCGPGTRLKEHLARGDVGINKLDNACMQHDIAYRDNRTAEARHPADLALAAAAEKVAADPNATKDERDKANFVTAVMRGKLYLGSGYNGNGTWKKYGGAPTLSADSGDGWTKLLNAIGSLFEYVGRRGNEEKAKKKLIEEEVKAAKEKIEEKKKEIAKTHTGPSFYF
ncbi:TPA_asm: PLA2X [Physarum slime mold MELD virus]|nr:TPA_asm: PLA2X [Physarum slime mold MELD virus]